MVRSNFGVVASLFFVCPLLIGTTVKRYMKVLLLISLVAVVAGVLWKVKKRESGGITAEKKKYKPVVIIHGVNEQPSTLQFLENFIREAHPGTDVHLIHILHGTGSFLPLWLQVQQFGEIIKNISTESEDGINLIGYSQGGLIARGVVSTISDLRIDTFVSVAGPQSGVYGELDKKDICFNGICLYELALRLFYIILYTPLGQLSNVGGYWKDPNHIDLYLKECKFLPILNNEVLSEHSEEHKANMLKLKRLVLIGARQDTTITPWQSSQFGFYDENLAIVEMKQQEVYTKDLFGLKTLDERGSLFTLTEHDLDHQDLPNDVHFLQEYLLPWLN